MQIVTRNIISGVLTIIPLAVTLWVIWFVVDLLVGAGRPVVRTLSRAVRPEWPELAAFVLHPWFQSGLALLITLAGLYLLGWAANAVLGRRLLTLFHRVVDRLPLASTIYRATHSLVESLRGETVPSGQAIVLIEFPMEGRHSIGLVTRIFPATEEREELAAVYVPTTPNPTSGFVQIIATSKLIWLDWSKNDAMAFVVSGGAMAPDDVPVERPLAKAAEAAQAVEEAKAVAAEVLAGIQEKVSFPGETLILCVEGENRAFGGKFRWMRGSRIV
jgi:uncharacterized membrane protein